MNERTITLEDGTTAVIKEGTMIVVEIGANNVKDYVEKCYKTDRYTGRDNDLPGYSNTLLEGYQKEYDNDGYCFTSKHESSNNRYAVWLGRSDSSQPINSATTFKGYVETIGGTFIYLDGTTAGLQRNINEVK
ncbi:MAG: hypothetical protein GY928_33990 [Colwellia sp.]|nr:hypothetical protein [Colwellia sp.]